MSLNSALSSSRPSAETKARARCAQDGVRCGSVLTFTRPESLRDVLRLGLNPYTQAVHFLFSALRDLTSEIKEQYLPILTQPQSTQLTQVFGRTPTAQDNDGIVPSLSRVWGDLIHVAEADHFDATSQIPSTCRPTMTG